MKLLIEHQCPQCGAPAILEETERLFTCSFCRVKSYLTRSDYFRYLLPHHAPENADLIYVPYWRYKGTLFSATQAGVRHRCIDVSHQALELTTLPISVGLRTQALKMKFATPAASGGFIEPRLAHGQVMKTFQEQFQKSLPRPVFHQAYVGDALSLIYAPFYEKGRFYDALLNQPLPTSTGHETPLGRLPSVKSHWPLHFLPALCPSCGWDLAGERDTLALACRNCNSMWQATADGFKKINFATLKSTSRDGLRYFPFWRIAARVSGVALSSYADLARLANLPVAMQPDWQHRAFRFWSPAFSLRPKTFLRAATQATLAPPRDNFTRSLPHGEVAPVTLPVAEALDSLKIILAGFAKPARRLLPRLSDILIDPQRYLLVYLPFETGRLEFIQPDLNLVINRTHLRTTS